MLLIELLYSRPRILNDGNPSESSVDRPFAKQYWVTV